MRAILVVAVDNLPSAGDNQQQYRPQEIPANLHTAGYAVGTSSARATTDLRQRASVMNRGSYLTAMFYLQINVL
jgi:hypothetical protein